MSPTEFDTQSPDGARQIPPRYEPRRFLGAGGAGDVYLVYDRVLEREVALKLLRNHHERAAIGFVDEARMCGRLDHPNIVPVYDLGRNDFDAPWFTMKVVQGETLLALVERRKGQPPDPPFIQLALEVLIKVCDGVAFANDRGILHRDLKSSNVMVGSFGEVFVMDWGIAVTTLVGLAADSDVVCGTPGYMSPEQAVGAPLDERCDVHGIGAIIYKVLTGEPPYSGRTGRARYAATLRREFDAPQTSRPGWAMPERLCAIAMKALAPDPADRFPNVIALRAALQSALRGGWWFEQRNYPAGARVLTQGDPSDHAFIVVSGTARVHAGDTVVRDVSKGEVFGELGLVAAGVRTADVVAVTDLTVMVVSRAALAAELGQDSWLSVVVQSLAERFREAHLALNPR
jgi:eukaryotic-like serine/threonine-protein kinase